MSSLFDDAVEQGRGLDAYRPAPYVLPSMEEVHETTGSNGLRAIGSFSGCGGSSLGMKMAGWDVLSAVEFIPEAARTYRENAPTTRVLEKDIRHVQASELLDHHGLAVGELDCWEGSPPCSSFSSAGSGAKDWGKVKKYSDSSQRTDDLFFEWIRIMDGLLPRAFIAENVPGLIRGRAVDEYAHQITRLLATVGEERGGLYHVDARVLNAANYGVPQERERLIFVGIRRDLGVRPDLGALPRIPIPHTLGQALERVREDDPADVAASSMEKYAVGRTWKLITEARARGGKHAHPDFRYLPCQRCNEPLDKHGNIETVSSGAITKATCADGEKALIAKDYFMLTVPHLDEPCPTVTATGAQAGAASVTHPTECRKMTPAELKAVCSFPDDFVLTGTREQRCERMGRAVPPLMMKAVSAYVARLLRGEEGQ